MEIKRNILFFPDKEGSEQKGYKPDAKLRMRVRFDKNVVNFNVGYRVELSKWIKDAQRCKPATTHGKKKVSATEINNEIQRLEELAESVFKSFEVMKVTPDKGEYIDAFNIANGKETGTNESEAETLFSVFDIFVLNQGEANEWTGATFTKFASIRAHLYEYNPKLTLKELTEKDLQGFVQFLHRLKIGKENIGMRNTTISKSVSFVRWFLRWAFARGYYEGNLHLTWRPKFKGTDGNQKQIIHLDWDELMKLYTFEVPKSKEYLDRVKDVFCFQCFTGLRYSDVAKLKRSDVREAYISIVTQKTTDGLKIELNKYSKAILDKYKDIPYPDQKVLPVISNVKMNIYLKELGLLAGLDEIQRVVYFKGNERKEETLPKWQLLCSHVGRKTFVVVSLILGIPAEVIMKWTGHSDFSAMRPYIKIVDELKEQEMNKFNMK